MSIDKEKTCVLIGAHPQNSNDSALLSLTIEGIKRQGYKICLVSHSPVNTDIQKSVNYYVYSDENEILTLPSYSNSVIFSSYSNYYYQSNLGNKLGSMYWWWYKTTDDDKWKIECYISEKLISSIEKRGVEILSNKPSYLRFKKNDK